MTSILGKFLGFWPLMACIWILTINPLSFDAAHWVVDGSGQDLPRFAVALLFALAHLAGCWLALSAVRYNPLIFFPFLFLIAIVYGGFLLAIHAGHIVDLNDSAFRSWAGLVGAGAIYALGIAVTTQAERLATSKQGASGMSVTPPPTKRVFMART